MPTINLKDKMTLTFSVDKCALPELNGTHSINMDLSKLTSDNIEQYIAQTLVIKYQAKLRSKNATKALLTETWIVPEPGKRITTDPVTKVSEMLDKLTPEQKALILKALAGDNDESDESDEEHS